MLKEEIIKGVNSLIAIYNEKMLLAETEIEKEYHGGVILGIKMAFSQVVPEEKGPKDDIDVFDLGFDVIDRAKMTINGFEDIEDEMLNNHEFVKASKYNGIQDGIILFTGCILNKMEEDVKEAVNGFIDYEKENKPENIIAKRLLAHSDNFIGQALMQSDFEKANYYNGVRDGILMLQGCIADLPNEEVKKGLNGFIDYRKDIIADNQSEEDEEVIADDGKRQYIFRDLPKESDQEEALENLLDQVFMEDDPLVMVVSPDEGNESVIDPLGEVSPKAEDRQEAKYWNSLYATAGPEQHEITADEIEEIEKDVPVVLPAEEPVTELIEPVANDVDDLFGEAPAEKPVHRIWESENKEELTEILTDDEPTTFFKGNVDIDGLFGPSTDAKAEGLTGILEEQPTGMLQDNSLDSLFAEGKVDTASIPTNVADLFAQDDIDKEADAKFDSLFA